MSLAGLYLFNVFNMVKVNNSGLNTLSAMCVATLQTLNYTHSFGIISPSSGMQDACNIYACEHLGTQIISVIYSWFKISQLDFCRFFKDISLLIQEASSGLIC